MIIVQNSRDQLYVHQRAEGRESGGLYGIGAGGKVKPNEVPHDAAVRELEEELKLKTPVEEMFDFPFDHPDLPHDHVYVFKTNCDDDIVPCQREFQSAQWMVYEQIDALARIGKLCPDTREAYERFKEKASGFVQ